jgi:hypothetical protein
VVLSGTSNLSHLEANALSLARGPLPEEDRAKLAELFGRVSTVTGG